MAAKMHDYLLWRTENGHSRTFTAITSSLGILSIAIYPADMVISKTYRSCADLHCGMQSGSREAQFPLVFLSDHFSGLKFS